MSYRDHVSYGRLNSCMFNKYLSTYSMNAINLVLRIQFCVHIAVTGKSRKSFIMDNTYKITTVKCCGGKLYGMREA